MSWCICVTIGGPAGCPVHDLNMKKIFSPDKGEVRNPACPHCDQQREIARQAQIELLDRDAKIHDLTIRNQELETLLKGYREKEATNA